LAFVIQINNYFEVSGLFLISRHYINCRSS